MPCRAVEITCKHFNCQSQSLDVLPVNLKRKLLELMSKRGMLNAVSLTSLLSRFERSLDLSESCLDDDCLIATKRCRFLQKLNLNPGKNQVHAFTSKALLELFPCLNLLSTLYMRRCPAVSDEVIESVARNCIHLSQLDIAGCTSLTDKSLVAIADGSPKLMSLNISRSQITDSGLASLSQGRSQHSLVELLVNECLGVTEKGVESILVSCSCMKYFLFHGCPVSEQVEQYLDLSPQHKMRQISWTIY
ncbi:protein AMN1 homolog isoform X2 [Ischnura elegans]|uniref:protein AMN1 homolog isoform X2 n=1 Tax=Ischnura elegans TaxID=197161 RepID=UPI001ED8938A|nr:protein AMN1 homolog isoform X2 [Ischnura elegans]